MSHFKIHINKKINIKSLKNASKEDIKEQMMWELKILEDILKNAREKNEDLHPRHTLCMHAHKQM